MQGDALVEKVAAALPDTYPSKPGDTVAVMMVRRVMAAMGATIPGGEAALIALLSGEGVVVPTEVPPEMLGAFWRVKNGHHYHDEPPPSDTSDCAAYRAMLATTPYAAKEGRDG